MTVLRDGFTENVNHHCPRSLTENMNYILGKQIICCICAVTVVILNRENTSQNTLPNYELAGISNQTTFPMMQRGSTRMIKCTDQFACFICINTSSTQKYSIVNSQYECLNESSDFTLSQDDIRSVMREGRQLLSNLEASKAVEGAAAEDRDISQDKERVQRYETHQWSLYPANNLTQICA